MKNSDGWDSEYPRPHLKRNSFINLNGEWLCNGHQIIVPFPPQAKASQYNGEITDELIYEKDFSLSDELVENENRILLHFGAIDQVSENYLNNYYIVEHEGGYLPFTFDISLYIKKENHLTVIVHDRLDLSYPYGKQTKNPHGMWYTAVSGIWQTVWLESVPDQYIKDIKISSHHKILDLSVDVDGQYKVIIPFDNDSYEATFHQKNVKIDLSDYDLHEWSCQQPYLYKIFIETKEDKIESYFALREMTIEEINHKKRVCLNHQPIFLHGVLDQGYYPEGHFIPADPTGYRKDIQNMKALGFNVLRKHIKIEPDIFYYYCDLYGMLVIQDMVNNGAYHFAKDTLLPTLGFKYRNDKIKNIDHRQRFFINHCQQIIANLYHHPSIIIYTIFNEGWGQFNSDQLYHLFKEIDSNRLYDSASGWFRQQDSDFESVHMYFFNRKLKTDEKRCLLLSECGGFVRKIEGHYQAQKIYGYGIAKNEEQLMKKIRRLYEKTVLPGIEEGLCGCIYTQLSDIENELNGIYTFDRKICKVNKKEMKSIAQQLSERIKKI